MNKRNTIVLVLIVLVLIIVAFFTMKKPTVSDTNVVSDQTQVTRPLPTNTTPTTTPTTPTTPKDTTTANKVLLSIYASFKTGMISECSYNGKKVYVAAQSAFDGGATVYDANGNRIDTVSGMNGKSDNGIAEKVTACKDIYVAAKNIWGKAAVNVYNLK